ncbi:MAG: methyltransferase domain-containing protein, partial [Planctomycetota bacterium]
YCVDDLFIAPKSRLRRIRDLIEKRGWLGRIRFKGFVRVNLVDEEVVRILKEIGFTGVRFGMETASERLLERIKDHPFTVAQTESVIELCEKYEMPVSGSFMFGIPAEEEEDIEATRRFLRKHRGRFKMEGFYLMQPVPGTRMWEECLAEGLVSADMDFSSMELDMSVDSFDWDRVLYVNEDRIPLGRFRRIMEEVRAEFLGPSPRAPTPAAPKRQAQSPSALRRLIQKGKALARAGFRRLGYDIRRIPPEPTARPAPRKPEKISGARLYVGCGDDEREGFIGCDMRARPNVSIVCKAWQVSQHCTDLSEIYSRHMLEHLTFDEACAALLDWQRALAVGGSVEVVVPNLDFHIEQWQRAEWTERALQDPRSDARWGFAGLYGWQRESGPASKDPSYWDVHKSGYNERLIAFLLRRAGFSDIETHVEEGAHLSARAAKKLDHRERQIAPTLEGIRADHRGRYEFAARLVPYWARVLDIGCGVGYGARIIANRTLALEIVAMDVEPEAVAYAREFHQTPKVRFQVGDALRAELPPERYDVAVAFEVICGTTGLTSFATCSPGRASGWRASTPRRARRPRASVRAPGAST